MSSRNFLIVAGLALLPVFFLVYQYAIPAEDAVILYEYAKNLATQGVITYGGANTPIEGATDFLWMLLIAVFRKIGIPEFFSALTLNFAGVMLLLVLIKPFGARLIALLGLFSTSYFYSALDGFSPIFFSAVYCWCLYLVLEKKSGLYFSLLILCLIRPDGVVWGAGLALLGLLEVHDREARRKEAVKLIKHLVVPGLAYFIWRTWYFSEWLPLPFLVKASGERDMVIFWFRSLVAVATALIPVLLAIIFVQDRRLYVKRLIFLFALPCFFYGIMHLEQNIGNRFLAPMFFGSLLLLSRETKLRSLVVFVVTSALLAFPTTIQTVDEVLDSKDANAYYISQELGLLQGKMLLTEAGRLAYYSNWITHDSWGLNTPRYAHNQISPADLREGSYDLIVGHCQLSLLKQAIPERTYKAKTWENQCRVLVSYIQKENYSIYLVPFLLKDSSQNSLREVLGLQNNNPRYKQYYMYAVSSGYKNAAELTSLLRKRGAISYAPELIP